MAARLQVIHLQIFHLYSIPPYSFTYWLCFDATKSLFLPLFSSVMLFLLPSLGCQLPLQLLSSHFNNLTLALCSQVRYSHLTLETSCCVHYQKNASPVTHSVMSPHIRKLHSVPATGAEYAAVRCFRQPQLVSISGTGLLV